MNAPRLRREQQVERNRAQLLTTARRVFLERGFHAATLDAIAEAAGFSKGVVYSQFDGKADLFLALLERRIEERAAENARIAKRAGGAASVVELLGAAQRATAVEPAWNLLLLEFRVHAARVPAIAKRYAALHARTVERLASALREAGGSAAARAAIAPETRAAFVLAVATGVVLEELAAPGGLSHDDLLAMVARALGVEKGLRAGSGAPARAAPRPRTGANPSGRKR